MTHASHTEHSGPSAQDASPRRWRAVFVGLLATMFFFLITEHRAHVLGVAPYLFLIAAALFCILGHGHGDHEQHERGGER